MDKEKLVLVLESLANRNVEADFANGLNILLDSTMMNGR